MEPDDPDEVLRRWRPAVFAATTLPDQSNDQPAGDSSTISSRSREAAERDEREAMAALKVAEGKREAAERDAREAAERERVAECKR